MKNNCSFPGGSDGKESAHSAGDPGPIPGLGRSPGGGNGSPLQYSCLENSVDRGAWQASPWGRTESDVTEWLSRSDQFSRSAVSDSMQPHESQHARIPCPSPTPRVHPNPCLSSRWCHPTLSSCRPLLLLPSIFPSIRVFSNESVLCIRWPKYWSFSFNISPSNARTDLL